MGIEPTAQRQRGVAEPAVAFVGRAAELATVAKHARRPRDEGPGIVVVTGAAGVGKTAFLGRLRTRLPGHRVLPVAAAPGPPFALANQVIAELHRTGAANGRSGGLGTGGPLVAPAERPHVAGQRLLTALSAAATDQRPLTVMIDDVQLADVESSLALGFAARRLYAQQVQFVLAVRSPDGSGEDPNVRRIMPARGDVLQIRLAGLSTAEVQALAEALGVTPLRRADAALIHAQCEGNPRYVTALLEEFRRDPHLRSGQPLVLRSSTASIGRQVAGLTAPSRGLLEALAVLGEQCPLSTAAVVADIAQPLLALEPLLTAGLAEWWPAEPTTPVRIRTPLLRQTVYQEISPQLRRVLHQRAAAVLPFDRALPHRRAASAGRTNQALAEDLADAAWRWTAEGNLDRAAQYLQWAADATEAGPDRDRRLLLGVSLLQRAGRYEAAAGLRERARACAPSALRSCVMGRFAMIDGDLAAAQELLESAVAEAERDRASRHFDVVATLCYTWLALLYGWLGEPSKALAAAGRCLALNPLGRRIDRSTELIYLGTRCELDGPVVALQRLAALADLPASPGSTSFGAAVLLMQRGHFRLLTGEPAEAVADIETALRTGRTAGITDIDEWGHFWAACAHSVLGSWDRALEHARAALDIVTADNRPHMAFMFALAAYVEANLGDLAVATDHANAAVAFAESFALPSEGLLPALATAAIARANGDPLGAVEALRPYLGRPKGWTRVYRWLCCPVYLEALIDLGRIDEAEAAMASMAEEIADGYRVQIVPRLYLSGRLQEATGNVAAAVAAYRSAVDAPAGLGHPQWRSWAASAEQRLLRESGVGTGGTGGGAADGTGGLADRLTARERAIANLIASGLTNKAVSGYLGVTEKTVEAHLTRVYRKLAVKSRGELRVALAPCVRSPKP